MPPKSKAQARMMNAAAHNPAFARKVGVSKKVAQEFSAEGAAYKRLPAKVKSRKTVAIPKPLLSMWAGYIREQRFCPKCKWSLTDCPSCGALQCRCIASIPIDGKLKVHAGIRRHWR